MSAGGGGERRRRGPVNVARRLGYLVVGERHSRENRYRDVLLLLAFGLMGWALVVSHGATDTANRATSDAKGALVRVQRGRQLSLAITCAALSAIGEAGRDTITGSQVDGRLAAFLEPHGYPPLSVRKAQSQAAARAYVRAISRHVDQELRQHGKAPIPGLVRSNGTIDCRVFSAVSAANVR